MGNQKHFIGSVDILTPMESDIEYVDSPSFRNLSFGLTLLPVYSSRLMHYFKKYYKYIIGFMLFCFFVGTISVLVKLYAYPDFSISQHYN